MVYTHMDNWAWDYLIKIIKKYIIIEIRKNKYKTLIK